MKKILVFLIILSNLSFGEQKNPINSRTLDSIIEQVSKDVDRGNTQKAISILKKKIAENPSESVSLKVMLAMLYEDNGKKKESEKELNEAIELQKKYPFYDEDGKKRDIKLAIGIIYLSMEDYENSLKWLKQAEDKDFNELIEDQGMPKDYFLGYISYLANNIEEAKKYLLKSYIHDKEGLSENVLGQIYFTEGNQKEAIKWFLASANKGNPGGQGNLGYLYYQLGDKKSALEWLQRAFETAKKTKDNDLMKEMQESIKEVKNSQK